jgi:hypothetical protein
VHTFLQKLYFCNFCRNATRAYVALLQQYDVSLATGAYVVLLQQYDVSLATGAYVVLLQQYDVSPFVFLQKCTHLSQKCVPFLQKSYISAEGLRAYTLH